MQKRKTRKQNAKSSFKKTSDVKFKSFEKTKLPDFKKAKKERRRLRIDRILIVIVIIAILALILIVAFSYPKLKTLKATKLGKDVVATVNNQKITKAQLDKEYEFFFFVRGIPKEYKSVVTKEVILNQTIDEMVLIEEAKNKGYSVSEQEMNEVMERAVNLSGMSIEEISYNFKQNNFSLDDLKNFYWKVLLVNKLLNETVNPKVNVSDEEIRKFYDDNNMTANFDEIKAQIRDQILVEKRYEEYQKYLNSLKNKAKIEIFYDRIS
ncbi:MAG: SurA N-terminal domain-containing protein [Candidatus Woesearchaeota archaeon]